MFQLTTNGTNVLVMRVIDMSEIQAKRNFFHMKRDHHQNEITFKCHICLNLFPSNYHLTLHKRSHIGARPFACPQCPMEFSIKGYLNRYLLIHSDKKNTRQKFTRKYSLVEHSTILSNSGVENGKGLEI